MNTEDIYNAWKEQKSDIAVPSEFADRVMNQINTLEQKKRKSLFNTDKLLEWLSPYPMVKVGLIASGAIIGFIRFLLTIRVVLG